MRQEPPDQRATPEAGNVTWLGRPGNLPDDLDLVARALEGIAKTLGGGQQTADRDGAAAALALSIGRLRALAESLRASPKSEDGASDTVSRGGSRDDTIKSEIAEILGAATPADAGEDSPTVFDVTPGGTTVRIRIEHE